MLECRIRQVIVFHPQFDSLSPSCKAWTSLGTMGSEAPQFPGLLKGGRPFIWGHYNLTKDVVVYTQHRPGLEWATLTLHTYSHSQKHCISKGPVLSCVVPLALHSLKVMNRHVSLKDDVRLWRFIAVPFSWNFVSSLVSSFFSVKALKRCWAFFANQLGMSVSCFSSSCWNNTLPGFTRWI